MLVVLITLLNCSGGDSGDSSISLPVDPQITVSNDLISFGQVYINTESDSQSMNVAGSYLSQPVNLSVTGPFKISSDNINFSNNVQVSSAGSEIFVKFSPTQTGLTVGEILLESPGADSVEVTLAGTGITVIHSYTAFNQQPLGFGGGFNQSAYQTFNLHEDLTNIKEIKMFLQIDCLKTQVIKFCF